ncbi:MAG: hypothetical protein V1793_09600 [Pseudomonadota bacterium]
MSASKKSTRKTESRFFLGRTLQEAQNNLEKKIQKYNTEVVEKKLNTGRTFVRDLKAEPLEKLDTLLDDTQKFVRTLSDNSRKKATLLVDDGKEFLKKAADQPFKTLGETVEGVKDDARKAIRKIDAAREKITLVRKKAVKGVDQDVQLILNDIADLGKKGLDRIPLKKDLGKVMHKGWKSIPALLNLPSRNDIDNLLSGLEGINKKVESLSGQETRA